MKSLTTQMPPYTSFRWFFTSSNVLVIGGKSDEQNEAVMREFLRPGYTVLHTAKPGSPFMIIQSEKPSKKDIEETAIVCAAFSQQWKAHKKDIVVDVFQGDQAYKHKGMKAGTFGVKGGKKSVTVNPSLVLVMQKGVVRAVPSTTKEKPLAKITRGTMTKEKATEHIAKLLRNTYQLPVSKEEIMQAIPADTLQVT